MNPEEKKLTSVLLVDDDDFIQDIYATKFKESGVRVTTARDGQAALEKLQKEEFDMILLDIIMPGTDGLAFLDALEKQGLTHGACVVVLSNQGQPDDIEKANAYDVDGYIIKASAVPSEVLSRARTIYQQEHA